MNSFWHRLPPARRSWTCRLVSLVVATMLLAPCARHKEPDWVAEVDPFIGTGGHGHTYPGATLPFGMVQLSPDTRLTGWDGCSGYHDTDEVVYGFSHTHLSGTGVSDYGDILFMPITGEPRLHNGADGQPGYASRFSKASERAAPGWYAVTLDDARIAVELTATERTGLHRYRFPHGIPAHVIVDLLHRDAVVDAGLRIDGPGEIAGWRRSSAWARDQVVYFAARFSRPFTQAALALDDSFVPGRNAVEGRNVKGAFSFGDAGGDLLVQVGISAVDLDGARRNLEAEFAGWDFEAQRHAARQRWNEALGRIEIRGGTKAQRTIFYTALYHSLLAPNLFSDVDGRYRGMDGQIHQATGRRHYTVFSLWDTFRATHPLFTLIAPERVGEFVATFLDQSDQGGRLPVWELAGNETDCMIGYHSVSVIADAWRKGIGGFDAQRALGAMVHSATLDHFGLEAYKRQGFIGGDDEAESVSKTLEYAYDDWCIAQMAAGLGRDDVARTFARRSQGWRHLFDPASRFLRPRVNQRWLTPFDPRRVDMHYTEANAWQYRFFVPHDVPALIDAMGGDEAFVARLDSLFMADSTTTGREQADITGRIGQYAHGNEPSHHMAWLYHYAGRPQRSIQRVRQILDTLYGTGTEGLCGNEDCGQMSSWYVLSALGLYPVCPGSKEYAIAPPLFDQTVLHLEGGRRFVIRRRGSGPALQEVRWNGEPLRRSFMHHADLLQGGELLFSVGSRADSLWGRDESLRPGREMESAFTGIPPILPAPYAEAPADVFRDSLEVRLACAETDADIRYTWLPLDSTAGVDTTWVPFTRPLVLHGNARLAFAARRGERQSPVVAAVFHRLPHDWQVQLRSVPNPQYTAGGAWSLVDGLRGKPNWRLGGWQGYEGRDFQAIVDLGRTRPIRRVGASFLQDVRSWIWMPREVLFFVSNDGKNFVEVARLHHDVPDDADGVILRDLDTSLNDVEGRYVKVRAQNYGRIPSWHPGSGGAAFIFVDEIILE